MGQNGRALGRRGRGRKNVADVITGPLLSLWMAFSVEENKGKRKGRSGWRKREREGVRGREETWRGIDVTSS